MKSILSKNLMGLLSQVLRASSTLFLLILAGSLLDLEGFSDLSRSFAICSWLMILMDGGTTIYYSNTVKSHAAVDGHPNATSNLIVNVKFLYFTCMIGLIWAIDWNPSTPSYLSMVFVFMATGNAIHFFSTCLRAEKRFGAEVGVAAVTFASTFGVLWIVLKLTNDFDFALVVAVISRSLIVAGLMIALYRPSTNFRSLGSLWRNIRPFFVFMLIGGMYSQLDFLIISLWGSDADVAFYVVYNQVNAILSLATASMSQLLLIDLSTKHARTDIDSTKSLYSLLNTILVAASTLTLGLVILFMWLIWSADISEYTHKFMTSPYVLPASILLVVLLIRVWLYIPLSELTAKGQQKYRNLLTLCAAFVNIFLLGFFYLVGLPLLWTVTLATLLSHTILLISAMTIIRTLPFKP